MELVGKSTQSLLPFVIATSMPVLERSHMELVGKSTQSLLLLPDAGTVLAIYQL